MDMDPIMEIAEKLRDIVVIEGAAFMPLALFTKEGVRESWNYWTLWRLQFS